MSESSLELSPTARARCKLCKEPIPKGVWRMRQSTPSPQFDGDITINMHAICAAMRRPLPLLKCLSEETTVDAAMRTQLTAIARTTRDRKLKEVVWRHATEPRCLLEFPKDVYVLVTQRDGKLVTVEGTLDEAIASCGDDDLQDVIDVAIASGKSVGRAAKPAPAKKPTRGKAVVLTALFSDGRYRHQIVLDEGKLRVSRTADGNKPQHTKLATVELARKYFRYALSQMTYPRTSFTGGDPPMLDPDEDFKDVKDKSPDYRYLEHGTQFWDIDRDYTELHLTSGAIGTKGTATVEVCDWDGDAKQRYKQLLAEKQAAGYAEPPGYAGRRAAGRR